MHQINSINFKRIIAFILWILIEEVTLHWDIQVIMQHLQPEKVQEYTYKMVYSYLVSACKIFESIMSAQKKIPSGHMKLLINSYVCLSMNIEW